ncbi:MAG: HAMP domain-containing sensor histidine kinase [Verrucomicrobiota bacterium]
MKRPHLSISTKILFCLALNVVALAAGSIWFVFHQSGGLGFIGKAATGANIQAFAIETKHALEKGPGNNWADILGRLGEEHQVQLGVFTSSGRWIAGPVDQLPDKMRLPPHRVEGGRPPRRPHDRARSRRQKAPDETSGNTPMEEGPYRLDFFEPKNNPFQWVRIKMPIHDGSGRTAPGYLLVQAKKHESDLFFNERTWIAAAILAVLGSIVLWTPLMVGISRRLGRLSDATDQIADGQLLTRVSEDPLNDDLSSLCHSVNRMASRLEEQVGSQKRFLGDVAHELSSPIARMQVALGLVETQGTGPGSRHLKKLDAQLQHMGTLVNELLLFSKSSHQIQPKREAVRLADSVRAAVEHESCAAGSVRCEVPDQIEVTAVKALLERAIGNVLRNSLRYAKTDKAIEVTSRVEGESVRLRIRDFGPGVPETSLPNLFDAFYRPESARNATSGGTGLGLAIVKSCIESCGGHVNARNRKPRGLEVLFALEKARDGDH